MTTLNTQKILNLNIIKYCMRKLDAKIEGDEIFVDSKLFFKRLTGSSGILFNTIDTYNTVFNDNNKIYEGAVENIVPHGIGLIYTNGEWVKDIFINGYIINDSAKVSNIEQCASQIINKYAKLDIINSPATFQIYHDYSADNGNFYVNPLHLTRLTQTLQNRKVFSPSVRTTDSVPIIKQQTMGENTMYYYDNNWQYPVVTEQQIFNNLRKQDTLCCDYVAFPWATLIDTYYNSRRKLGTYTIDNPYYAIQQLKIKSTRCFTVCQHIHFRVFLPLFKSIGITHVFTPHCAYLDANLEHQYNVKIIPISLFPVNCFTGTPNEISRNRRYLCSFVGSYNRGWYLSDIRKRLVQLSNNDNCYVKVKGKWNFDDIVYSHQIHKKEINLEKIASEMESNKISFQDLIMNSTFSLCPGGSGPNSIRLWESLSFGSIPVILSNAHKLPEFINWREFCVVYDENNINGLYDYLKSFDAATIEKMKNKCLLMYEKYFSGESMHKVIERYFSKINIISYCCGTYPSVGGVARYDTQLHMALPDRVFFMGPQDKTKMLAYLESVNNPVIITDNHLACDIPNKYPVLLVHHGCAMEHFNKDPQWNRYWRTLCCDGQNKMLRYRDPSNTWIISSSSHCTYCFGKYYTNDYIKFKNTLILHPSELDDTVFHNAHKIVSGKITILGNWPDKNKGKFVIDKLSPILNNYAFTQLNVSPHKNESIDSFNKRKQEIYINSDVYMGLSLQEGNSYALVDALQCGLPILSTNVGLFYSDVPDNAFVKIDLALKDNPDYIKEKLEYAVNNKETLGANARTWYLANCAFSNWKLNMHNIVHNIYDYVYVDTSSNI